MPGAAGRRWKASHSRRCTPGHAPSNEHRAENSPVVTGHVLRAMFGLTLTEPDDPKAVRLGIEGVCLGEYARPRAMVTDRRFVSGLLAATPTWRCRPAGHGVSPERFQPGSAAPDSSTASNRRERR